MDGLIDAVRDRHSVRRYREVPVEPDKLDVLRKAIDECNSRSGFSIQIVTEEPRAFDGFMAHYGKFSGVRNYIAMIGKKGCDEIIGYYGEKLVLLAQSMGINTCWVALTFSKRKAPCNVGPGERFYCAITFGYGETQGVAHRSRDMSELCETDVDMPEWFRNGVEAAMLAPTAINQQKFRFVLKDSQVTAVSRKGPCSEIDFGIVKYHFELGSDRQGLFGL